jgi:hypothetical protein
MSMKKSFKSRDFFFRPTAIGAAFMALGATEVPMVREAKRSGLLRAKTDTFNREPSVVIEPIPADVRPAKTEWKSMQGFRDAFTRAAA